LPLPRSAAFLSSLQQEMSFGIQTSRTLIRIRAAFSETISPLVMNWRRIASTRVSKRYEPDSPSIGKRGEVSLCIRTGTREIMIKMFFPMADMPF
jgi:hypothetical protein